MTEILGHFRHNEQSVRVVEFLEREGRGLNLAEQVRDGILRHSKIHDGVRQRSIVANTAGQHVVNVMTNALVHDA